MKQKVVFKYMRVNDLGKTVKPIRWTRQAALCYCIGSNCNRCDIPSDIIPRCKMRVSVLELVKTLGKPPKKMIQKIEKSLGEKQDFIIDD